MTGTSLRSWTPWLVTLHLLICCAPTVEARQSDDALENSYKTSVIQELTEKALTLADLYKLSQNKSDREKINKLYDEGKHITYWTARGSLSGSDYFDLTKKQLDEWECKYHELSVGEKPLYDLLICDKTKRIEEI